LWFIAQYTFNISLVYTTVTSNTILSSSSSLFTYLMSIAFLGERYTHGKLLSIIACIAGEDRPTATQPGAHCETTPCVLTAKSSSDAA
jgi:hypothetical protein